MVPALVAEFDDFVLNGRAVSGTCSLYDSRVDGRAVQVLANYVVGLLVCIGQIAGNLLNLDIGGVGGIGEGYYHGISGLYLHLRIIQCPAVHSGGSPGLESSQRNTQPGHRLFEPGGTLHAPGTCLCDGFSDQTSGIEVGSGADNHRFAGIDCSCLDPHTAYTGLLFFHRNLIELFFKKDFLLISGFFLPCLSRKGF